MLIVIDVLEKKVQGLAALLQAGFVALAADCDDPEPLVADLAGKLEDAMMLPFVLFAEPDGTFLGGSAGAVEPKPFAATLARLAPGS